MPDTDQPETHEPQPPESAERSDSLGETAAPIPPPRLRMRAMFLGSDGLRAGWSVLLYFGLFFALLFVMGSLVSAVRHHVGTPQSQTATQTETKPSSPSVSAPSVPAPAGTVLETEGITVFGVLVATWLMGKIERRPNSAYGLGGRRQLGNFFAGLGWGVALLTLLVFSLRACGLLIFDARQLLGASALRYGVVWFSAFLLVGVFEECFFRGYLQFTLARGINGIYGWLRSSGTHTTEWSEAEPRATGLRTKGQNAFGFWAAALLLSFGFGFVHRTNPGESPIGLLSASLVSVVFCLSLWRTGSLWWAIGFHAAWDWAQSFLYGVADSGMVIQGHLLSTHPEGRPVLSGGLTGPEGSLFILPILGLIAAVIMLTLRRNRFAGATVNTPEPPLN